MLPSEGKGGGHGEGRDDDQEFCVHLSVLRVCRALLGIRPQKADSGRRELVAGVFWGLAVALYLALSFITNAWDRTWIIWPVAGVTYGVVAAITSALRKKS